MWQTDTVSRLSRLGEWAACGASAGWLRRVLKPGRRVTAFTLVTFGLGATVATAAPTAATATFGSLRHTATDATLEVLAIKGLAASAEGAVDDDFLLASAAKRNSRFGRYQRPKPSTATVPQQQEPATSPPEVTGRPKQPYSRTNKPPRLPAAIPASQPIAQPAAARPVATPPQARVINAGTPQATTQTRLIGHQTGGNNGLMLPPAPGASTQSSSRTTLGLGQPTPPAESVSSLDLQTQPPQQRNFFGVRPSQMSSPQPGGMVQSQATTQATSPVTTQTPSKPQQPRMTKKQQKDARIAAINERMRRSAPIAAPVPPPVPMSLRPGYTRRVASGQITAPGLSGQQVVTLPGIGEATLPPPAPPANEVLSSSPSALATQQPAATANDGLPSIAELGVGPARTPAASATPQVAAAEPVAEPAAEPMNSPTQLAVTPQPAAGPVDLTTREPQTFPLRPMPNLPLAMPKHQELFPADRGRFVDPELVPVEPSTTAATTSPRAVSPPVQLETAPRSPLAAAAPPAEVSETNAPAAPQVDEITQDDSFATVSIDTLTPEPNPLPVVPKANPIAEKEAKPSPQFNLPVVSSEPTETGVAGFCPVALCEQRELVDASDEFRTVYLGRLYKFASADALNAFRSNPRQYAPAARGRDVVMLAEGQGVEDGRLDFAVWFRGRLYLFANAGTMKSFSKDPKKYVASN